MYGTSEHFGADDYCIHCNAPIYFDIGIGNPRCKSCGELYSEKENREQQPVSEFPFVSDEKLLDNEFENFKISVELITGQPVSLEFANKLRELRRTL